MSTMTKSEIYYKAACAIYKDILPYFFEYNPREKMIDAATKLTRDFDALQVRKSKRPHFDFDKWTNEELGLYLIILLDRHYIKVEDADMLIASKSRISALEKNS